ncbi:peptidase U32 family protein [Desulfurivibrio alkaliphilus]|uniref:Peptidase U32 n=1 Tax=Desulfurivibrio alkaliphilus (strain DSM 19089 / UNIQEM U267 / AHT2) TaxID=589865 RepID=D6Z0I1_DESAT|nr:peptidase U32 family protein [Desulfurivibrio alkaliphilus]ADH85210.1 peptidase U32 [Desulfurivibrio alkaliphilus AHT 2]
MELLAPAGNLETFAAAVEAGADAIYIGAPGANARALARDLPVAEIAAMIDYAHGRGVRVYAAMNSLLKEDELVSAAATVEMLAGLKIDALIIQDLGLHRLCRRFFPDLRLHASTLMGAHNSLAVHQLDALGFARVVLARELTLAEIADIGRQSRVGLEVFVHGAMCFSYSGLCLFSSYLGGKSSMRGRCVQPCRRAYRWSAPQPGGPGKRRGAGRTGREEGGKAAYLFSMNDLAALELLPELWRAGVGSIKIEGRMKSAQYVDRVVRAYRRVLDALQKPGEPGEHGAATVERAMEEGYALLAEAMGRRTSTGFLQLPFKELVTPGHSGNIGHFLGKLSPGGGRWARLKLRHSLRKGDRLRLHREQDGERTAFTLQEIRLCSDGGAGSGKRQTAGGEALAAAREGQEVELRLPVAGGAGDSLYLVDLAQRRRMATRCALTVKQEHRRRAASWEKRLPSREMISFIGAGSGGGARTRAGAGAGGRSGKKPREKEKTGPPGRGKAPSLPLWLRLDDLKMLPRRLPPEVERVVLPLSPVFWPQLAAAGKLWRSLGERLIWALPPVMLENDLPFYRAKIAELRSKNCNAWQLGHLSQLQLFADAAGALPPAAKGGKKRRPRSPLLLYGDYTLNILNSLAGESYGQLGLASVQAAIETDRDNLLALLAGLRPKGAPKRAGGQALPLGLTLYGRPPLFTSRLDSVHFRYQVPFLSPREERFVLLREHDLTLALAARPFSLLSRAEELAAAGLAFGVVDLRYQKISRQELLPLLRQAGKTHRRSGDTDNFNFLAGLD